MPPHGHPNIMPIEDIVVDEYISLIMPKYVMNLSDAIKTQHVKKGIGHGCRLEMQTQK